MTEFSRQQLKERRRVQDAQLFPPPGRMLRLAKRRPRAGLANQEPKDREWRLAVYRPMQSDDLTAAQRRRIDHKAHRAIAVAERKNR